MRQTARKARQPDFAALWREHFGKTPRRVTYEVRRDSNRFHDFAFLTSLVHDARFKREDLQLRGQRLTIPIERDCWELYQDEKSRRWYIAAARLTFSPVSSLEWQFKHETRFRANDEFSIEEIWMDHQVTSQREAVHVTIYGFAWRCLLSVRDTDLRIRLQDVEVPRLVSRGRT